MRRAVVAGNWKMHGSSEQIATLLTDLSGGLSACQADVIVFPPFVYLSQVIDAVRGTPIACGAQTVSEYEVGAYTGEISAAMLCDLGCSHVLVGHSERRQYFGGTDLIVAQKFKVASEAGLTPILCVGETESEREAGQTESVVGRQLQSVVECAGIGAFKNACLAYEPVWAIGTGKTATPEMAEEVHSFLRQTLAKYDPVTADKLRILYGGSVKPDNAEVLFAQPNIDGGLVGGASLKAQDFLAICHSVTV